MGDVIGIKLLQDAAGLGFLAFGDRILVDALKHELAQGLHGLLDLGRHAQFSRAA